MLQFTVLLEDDAIGRDWSLVRRLLMPYVPAPGHQLDFGTFAAEVMQVTYDVRRNKTRLYGASSLSDLCQAYLSGGWHLYRPEGFRQDEEALTMLKSLVIDEAGPTVQ